MKDKLLEEICEAIVNIEGYRLTWVGSTKDREKRLYGWWPRGV